MRSPLSTLPLLLLTLTHLSPLHAAPSSSLSSSHSLRARTEDEDHDGRSTQTTCDIDVHITHTGVGNGLSNLFATLDISDSRTGKAIGHSEATLADDCDSSGTNFVGNPDAIPQQTGPGTLRHDIVNIGFTCAGYDPNPGDIKANFDYYGDHAELGVSPDGAAGWYDRHLRTGVNCWIWN